MSLFTAYESYRDTAMLPQSPPMQISECRRAFMAGAWAVLTNLRSAPEFEVDDHMTTLEAECAEFNRRVQNGLA